MACGKKYGHIELEMLWRAAGGPPKQADLMASIAQAESGGCAEAVNPEGPEHAEGLWQIKGKPFAGNSLDPLTNARMAVSKYKSQGLGAWETYTSGAYKKFLGQGGANENVQGTGFLGIGVGPTVAPEASERVREAAEQAASWTGDLGKVLSFIDSSSGWVRIGKVAGGAVLLGLAVNQLIKSETGKNPAKAVTKTAATAAIL